MTKHIHVVCLFKVIIITTYRLDPRALTEDHHCGCKSQKPNLIDCQLNQAWHPLPVSIAAYSPGEKESNAAAPEAVTNLIPGEKNITSDSK